MPILALENTPCVSGPGSNAGLAHADPASIAAFVGTGLLRRNTAMAEGPDPRYWTAYDYYTIEREARAMRAAQIGALLGKGWQALSRLILG